MSALKGVWAIIPARYQSSRFPGKPLTPISGTPLVVRVWQRVAKVLPEDHIAVATDDERIRRTCEAAGVRVVMTSEGCLTGTDRVYEAAAQLDATVVLNVQGDEPLVKPTDLMAVLSAKLERPAVVVNGMCRISSEDDIHNPNVPKVVVNRRGELVYMSRAAVPYMKDPAFPPTYYRQVCIYAFSLPELKAFSATERKMALEGTEDIEVLRFVDLGIPVQMVEVSGGSWAVDEPADVVKVEQLLANGA